MAMITTILTTNEYDHMGRLIEIRKKINSQPEITQSDLSYNEIGQLKTKRLHTSEEPGRTTVPQHVFLNEDDIVQNGQALTATATESITLKPGFHAQPGSVFSAFITAGVSLQEIHYTYNSRGWLKKQSSEDFDMELKYQDGSIPQYNGNISNQVYNNGNGPKTLSYSYDKLNRLLIGEVSPTELSERLTYDVMGNITSLNRDGTGANIYTYRYGNSNQLQSVANVTAVNYDYDVSTRRTTACQPQLVSYSSVDTGL
ncbi:hypothetical protein B0I27_1161 [Arcticibacter pallidicorallinus]|uniref:YD repeat-containing protein n=1 Tax=Arcticibacter pallidicorallinus TaxID=1259464 RepID=A0A2T0TQZ3_9SPHI|nr:3-coathanger stack domain-containing protein [Arcticibacter pallidicorallinus]PRY48067.1 hypothetical protein B0I27_1161 [Arcticibacter pallidicorallinus]